MADMTLSKLPHRFVKTACLCAAAMCLLLPAPANATRDIETRGLLASPEQGQIAPDIWAGLTRNDALMLIDALPARYASPTYFRMAERLLLSDAPALPAGDSANPDRPDVLIARLDKLLEIGALRSAEELYEGVVDGVPPSFDLALRSLQVLMLRGQLPAACLDLQTMQAAHGTDRRWREMNALCMIRFADRQERAKLLSENTFEAFPILNRLLKGGLTPSRLAALGTSDLAFAAGLGFVDEAAMRQLTAKAGTLPPLLLTVLYELDTENQAPEKTCLAIEGLRRGLLTTRELITLYERPHYDAALLLDNINLPPGAANIHPCMVPTVLYQRVASNKEQPNLDVALRVAFDVMKGMPDAAFLPMAVYIKDMDVHLPANRPYLSRAARVLAYEKETLPESWEQGWADEGRGVSPFWLVHAIVKRDLATAANLATWREQWPDEAKKQAARDPYLPVILGRGALQADSDAPKSKSGKAENGDNYDKELSLTFSRTYAMPSYGLTQRLKDVIEKGQTGQSVALILIGYGAIPPDQIIPDQMALIIEGLNKIGLRGDAQRVALEVLR